MNISEVEERLNAWCSLPEYKQKQYIDLFPEIAEFCGNDLAKRIQLWTSTGKTIQEQHQEFFTLLVEDIKDTPLYALAVKYGMPDPSTILKNTSITVLQNNTDCTVDMFCRVYELLNTYGIIQGKRLQRNGFASNERYIEKLGDLIRQHTCNGEKAESPITPEEMICFYCETNELLIDLTKRFDGDIPSQAQIDFIELRQHLTDQVLKYPDILTRIIEDKQFQDQIQLDNSVLIEFIKHNITQPERLSRLLPKINLDSLGLEGIIELNNSGINISRFINQPINIPLSEYREMGNNPNIPSKLRVCLICESVADLSIEDLNNLPHKSRCTSIAFRAETIETAQKAPYSIKEYIMYRGIIDNILQNIVIPDTSEPDREKKIFGQVMPLIARSNKISRIPS